MTTFTWNLFSALCEHRSYQEHGKYLLRIYRDSKGRLRRRWSKKPPEVAQ